MCNFMITEQNINNLHKLSKEDVKIIMHECAEILCVCDIKESEQILGKKKRRIYQLMNEENTFHIGIHKFPCINLIK
jgi:hypothetical protein